VNNAAAVGVTVKPVVYCSESHAASWFDSTVAAQWTPWIAAWPTSPNPQTGGPSSSTPWSTWTLWQYADNTTVPNHSGNVDGDVFNGTMSALVSKLVIGTAPPVIITQPATVVNSPGQTATFGVVASGATSYQWTKNGINLANGGNISGATAVTLTIGNAQLSDAGFYTVVASNAGGSVTSGQAQLVVTATAVAVGTGTGLQGQYYDNLDFTGLKLTRTDATVNFDWGSGSPDPGIGADTFSVRWIGQVQPRYSQTYTFYTRTDDGVRLWVNGVLLIDKWVDQSSFEWSGALALSAGQAYDIQMDYYENGGSATAQLNWSSASQTKEIIPQTQLYPTQPSGVAIPGIYNTGLDSNNALLAAGAVDPHFQLIASADSGYPGPNIVVVNDDYPTSWLTDGPNSKWIAPQAAQSSSGNASGNYTYRLTFDLSGLNLAAALISGNWVVDNSGVDLLLNGVSTGQINSNGYGLFTAFVIRNGFLPHTNTLDFVVNNGASAPNATGLRVELSGLAAQGFLPVVSAQPTNQFVAAGQSGTFCVTAGGTAPLYYQWQWVGHHLFGVATNNTCFSTPSVGDYCCIITNSMGAVTSAVATLTVLAPPTLTSQSGSLVITQGDSASFCVTGSGMTPLYYQWQWLGHRLFGAGTNNTCFTTPSAGGYCCTVTNVGGAVTSAVAYLTVVVPPTNQAVMQGANVSLVATVMGTDPSVACQWQKNGVNLGNGDNVAGVNTPALNLSSVAPNDVGSYTIVVSNGAGSSVNLTAALSVVPPVTAQPGVFTGIGQLGDGSVELTMSGTPYTSYVLQFTTDWQSWSNLGTLSSTNGLFQYNDLSVAFSGSRFYRLKLEP
jgi:hypothetical protein